MKHIIPLITLLTLASCGSGETASDASGNFETTEVIVFAQASGQLLELHADEGATLAAGDRAGLIDTTDGYLQKQILLAQRASIAAQAPVLAAQLEVQRQQLRNIETDAARLQNLYRDNAATQKQLDDVAGAVAIAKRQMAVTASQRDALDSQLATVDSQIAQIDHNITKCRITNPLAGTVLVKYAEAGELVAPGKPLYKIGDLSRMILTVYVSEKQLSAIGIGRPAEALFDAPAGDSLRRRSGIVSWISDKAEFTPKIIQTRDERVNLVYAVKIAVPNPDGALKIGMPGEALFH
ncbi:MAG: efflux RND transporter periplasmic adaptor subunit [Prevotellaceae bacterium]|nr:efflux RND transporter periplasmic adaptor subunit [Prevotellaceae bacterium]